MIPILAIMLVLELLLRGIPNPYKVKSDFLEANNKSIETLILGSSHAFYGVNPVFLSNKAINFANVSQTIDIDYQLLEHFAPSLPNLKYVIIRLSYATLYEQLGNSNESWRLKDYNLYTSMRLDWSIKHQFEVLSVKLDTNIERVLQYYFFDSFELNTNEHGWGITSKTNLTLNESGLYAAKKHTIQDKSFYTENVKNLETIVNYCNTRNIQVVLVTTPTHKSYFSNLDDEQLKPMQHIGEMMEKKYDNCRYYNLLKSSMFTDADFFDGDHVNAKGAEKLTKLINQALLRLEKN
ncbi:family 20 glycosylhydrolase [Mariniflexile sp.]|uniref:family 20 glycosylhydrolase n=1 Tax=Mariniflexile sp. TaxID=1979402 RepID=UPI003563CB2A